MQTYNAVGRRKNAVARVRLMPGTGKRIINDVQMKKYLQRETLAMIIEPVSYTHLTLPTIYSV